MDKKYEHKIVENDKNQKWIDKEFFSKHDNRKKPYTIILPPPNVTGKLHLGHAWDGYIQDTLIRFKKLNGFDVMWVPGMDHAGIATQAKVEERLAQSNISKYDLGREKFLEKIWEWKEEFATTIRSQWAKLGLGLDFPNERFTMDKGLSDAVNKVFIDMYNKGLIYRGERAINWDPQLQTVLSNIEVDNKDTEQEMIYIKLDVQEGGTIEIATTRPETMFSDVAIAVNPDDETMKKYIGKNVIHPLSKKVLPIIGDRYIEIGKGTGAMKVSAHALADIDIIKKNNLEVIETIDKFGKMNEFAGEYIGLDRFDVRQKIKDTLSKQDRITKIEKVISAVGYSSRSHVPVEILVQPQWFVKMQPLAKMIVDDLNSGNGVKFFPGRFEDTLRTWMTETLDWTISRQLWWGHRIPAWYKEVDDEIVDIKVQINSPGDDYYQDQDVLDTWFSSGIAPFSFLGWPNNEEYLKRYYPTSTLVTGYDIIFFWVARMYFQSLAFMDEKPFNHVLIHGLIRGEDGRKMSKSLGNGIDPMDVIEEFGSDSLRWFLLTNSSPGNDIRYSRAKIEAGWSLINKLWNISRFIIEILPETDVDNTDADNWILNKLSTLEKIVSQKMEEYEFTVIGKELSSFIYDDFSSWYIELSKTNPNKRVAKLVLEKLLIILHPFLPFVSDHIYKELTNNEILEQEWKSFNKTEELNDINKIINIVTLIRVFRNEKGISNNITLNCNFTGNLTQIEKNMISSLSNSKLGDCTGAVIPVGNDKLIIELSDEMKKAETERIKKQKMFLENEIARAKGILSNERFVSKAPAEKIEEEKRKLEKFESELKILLEVNNG